MFRKLFLLLLCGGAAGTFFSLHPATSASGHLPRFYRVTLEIDNALVPIVTAVPAAGLSTGMANANLVQYTISLDKVSALRGPQPELNWAPFVRGLTLGAFTTAPAGANPPVIPLTVAALSLAMSTPGNLFLSANEVSGPGTCVGMLAFTSADGRSITIAEPFGVSNNAVIPCMTTERLWELEIPSIYLASNHPNPEVLVSYTMTWTSAGPLTNTIEVSVPWVTTSTELMPHALHFHRIVPSSTIQAAALTSLFVSFTPARQLVGGMYISLLVRWQPGLVAPGIFADIAGLASTVVQPNVAIGVNGCSATPSDIYCCSESRVTQPGRNTDTARFQLFPLGCALPPGKLVTFTIGAPYLANNPATTAAPGAAFVGVGQFSRVLNTIIFTSGETAGTYDSRLGRPAVDWWNPQTAVRDSDGLPFFTGIAQAAPAAPVQSLISQVNYYSNWAVGPSAVSGFSATPSTLLARVIPDTLTLSWILTTAINLNGVAATIADTVPPRFLVSANANGVFRRNIGSPTAPRNLVMSISPDVAACSNNIAAPTYFTDEYGALWITPNPTFIAACFTALAANSRVTFIVPKDALLPNPSGAQPVTFDVRGVSASQNNLIFDGGIDLATSMNNAGYTTTTDCGTAAVPSLTRFSSPCDISSLAYADRATLVDQITTLSTGPAAIKQCPVVGTVGTVTWVKFPEAAWKEQAWPLTNVAALGSWAQVVGSSPTIAMQNWGQMVTNVMFSVIVTYPPQAASLLSLGVVDSVPTAWQLAFIIRNDRLTVSAAIASLANPWQFLVTTTSPIVAVKLIAAGTSCAKAGTNLETIAGGVWAQNAANVAVTVPQSGLVFGYTALLSSPIPDDGSDDALFGLLALIAVPVLLCCCLLALLWFLRPKAEACPCVPEYPVQEMYWVNAQPCAPTFSVAQCGPSTTPVYLVQ